MNPFIIVGGVIAVYVGVGIFVYALMKVASDADARLR